MTLEEMEAKILMFEKELACLSTEFHQLKVSRQATSESIGVPKRAQALPNKEISLVELIGEERFRGSDTIKRGFVKFMEDAKIPYKPVGIEELRRRLTKANLAPDELSRGIIEMREE